MRQKHCHTCDAANPLDAEECHACGESFLTAFEISLKEALRDGAIVRGASLSEAEVQQSERIAVQVRQELLRSGDENLIRIMRQLPEESWAHLKQIMDAA
jgi:hypothetical protein